MLSFVHELPWWSGIFIYNNIEAEELTLTFQALFAVLALQATNAEVRIAKGHST